MIDMAVSPMVTQWHHNIIDLAANRLVSSNYCKFVGNSGQFKRCK